jgi:hypothetical protein
MRPFLIVLLLGAVALAAPTLAAGDEPASAGLAAADDGYVAPSCDDPDISTLAVVDCAGIEPVPSLDPDYADDLPTVESLAEATAASRAEAQSGSDELPAYCRVHAHVYFYTASDWLRLGQKLEANASSCADYYITIPPLAADKTGLRCPLDRPQQDDLIRALGPRFHPVVEFHFAGWRTWWRSVPGRTPADAVHLFLQRVRECGYDFSRGETWSLNELHSGIAANNPGARDEMREVLDTLAAGAPEMPASRGIVWVIGVGQQTQNLSVYKARLQEWLQDTPFWEDMARDVSVWGQETYPNMRFWGNADTSRNARTRNLSLFLQHPLLLAETGPEATKTARDFLEQTYVPLASAAWPYASGFGNTAFSDLEMKRFISEQAFAVKHFSQSRPHAAPDARFAMAWAPNSQCGTELCTPVSVLIERTAGILDRLASAIREAYEYGGGSQAGACGEPGDHTWCDADIPGAEFNLLWATFPDW